MGINLWWMDQKSTRWNLYRLNSQGHNVPSIDGALQRAQGKASIMEVKDGTANGEGSSAKLDLSSLYPAAKRALREGVLAQDGRSYALTDTFVGLKSGASVTWQMVTRAAATAEGNVLTLKDGGKTLTVRAPEEAVWTIAPAEGPKPLNTPNPGATMVSFTLTAGDVDLKIRVNFTVEK